LIKLDEGCVWSPFWILNNFSDLINSQLIPYALNFIYFITLHWYFSCVFIFLNAQIVYVNWRQKQIGYPRLTSSLFNSIWVTGVCMLLARTVYKQSIILELGQMLAARELASFWRVIVTDKIG